MKKSWLFILVCIFFVTAMSLFVVMYYTAQHHRNVPEKNYDAGPITVVVDWEIERAFDLRVFYKTHTREFSIEESVKIPVNPSNKHIEVKLPATHITALRLDLGSKQNKVIIKNIEVKADQFIDFNNWDKWNCKFVSNKRITKDNHLEFSSTDKRVQLVYQDFFSIEENTPYKAFLKEQEKFTNNNVAIEPTTAKIIITGKIKQKIIPFEVYLNNSTQPLEGTRLPTDKKTYIVTIELNGNEGVFEIKSNMFSPIEIKLTKPINEERYINYTFYKDKSSLMIHPKSPFFATTDFPFLISTYMHKGQSNRYELKWQKVIEKKQMEIKNE